MALLGFLQKGWRWILFILLAPFFALIVPAHLLHARSARPAARLHARLLLLVPEAATAGSPPRMTSLIIITLRRAALLRNTLQSLTRQTRPLDEIVVIDNGPDADTEQVARSLGAR